jgi:methylenetetrahydrofolate dehydrogenase (NADP+)/methenyltetrahydrofolate cyclohydrolase
MTAILLDGRSVARTRRAALRERIIGLHAEHGIVPCLAVVQVAGDPAADAYVRSIRKQCEQVSIVFLLEHLPADTSQATLNQTLARLSADPMVQGILLQLPLPDHLDLHHALLHLDFHKDVDGIHPTNAGLLAQGQPAMAACASAGGMALLHHYDIPIEGKHVAMVGWGMAVGRPLTGMLLRANATVTVCHAHTVGLVDILKTCEIVAVAVGHSNLITGEMLRPGAVVLDFGINVQPDESIVGDVDFASASRVASAITPVPGGTGPMTNVILLENVLKATEWQIRPPFQ